MGSGTIQLLGNYYLSKKTNDFTEIEVYIHCLWIDQQVKQYDRPAQKERKFFSLFRQFRSPGCIMLLEPKIKIHEIYSSSLLCFKSQLSLLNLLPPWFDDFFENLSYFSA